MQRLIWSIVGLMIAAVQAIAQPHHPSGPGGEPGMPRLGRLELTDTQQKQVEDLRLAHQKKMIQIRSSIEQGRLDLRAAREASSPDRATVEKAIKAVADLELQAKLERTRFWFELRALLTPKQQELLKEMPDRAPMRRHGPPPPACRHQRCG